MVKMLGQWGGINDAAIPEDCGSSACRSLNCGLVSKDPTTQRRPYSYPDMEILKCNQPHLLNGLHVHGITEPMSALRLWTEPGRWRA